MAFPTVRDSTLTNPGGTGNTITVTLPTHAAGDVIIIPIGNTGNATWAGNPAGWTRWNQNVVGTSSNGVIGTAFARLVLPGDTLPLANPLFTLGAVSTRAAFAWAIDGALESAGFTGPWNGTSKGFNTGTANPVRPPLIRTPTPDSLILHFYFQRSGTNAPDPVGYTQDEELIISGTLVGNASRKTVAESATSISNQDASPTSGVRWTAGIIAVPILLPELIGRPYGPRGEIQMAQLLAT